MGTGLIKTKRRIASVTSTKKVTNAMELIATVKLNRFKNNMLNNKPYSDVILDLIKTVYASGEINNELTNEVESDKSLVLVITSSLGLCGGYNSNIFKFLSNSIGKNDDILCIGNKGNSHFAREEFNVTDLSEIMNTSISNSNVKAISDYLIEKFKTGEYKEVKLIYTHYVNSIKFEPVCYNLLPLRDLNGEDNGTGFPPIFEPDVDTILNALNPLYVNSKVYQCLLESEVSEQASRRNAMDNANDNADELLGKLLLEYNKARQAAITNEITEVTSAAKANE